jgi:predicted metal-dependent phosphoesterase TrpH
MRFDLHVHTGLYSSCSKAQPEEMVKAALRYGLDGIVLTEHDNLWQEVEVAALRATFPELIILRGIEVTVSTGDHFLVYGVLEPELFMPRMETRELLAIVEERGGAAVLAHPYRYRPEVPAEIFQAPPTAIECMSINICRYMQEAIVALRQELDIPYFASSDAHRPSVVGLYGLEFSEEITDEVMLAQTLREGRFQPFAERKRIEELNTISGRELPKIQELIAEGKTNKEIREEFQYSFSVLTAIRQGGDIGLITL